MSIAAYIYPSGLGFSLGDTLVTGANLYSAGAIWYLDNSSANASDSNTGDDDFFPWSTLSHALSTAAAGDIVVVGAAHDETLAADLTCANRLTIVGAGSSGGNPTATFRVGAKFLTMSANYTELRNLKFVCTSTATSNVTLSGNSVLAKGCRFEAGAGCTAGALIVNGTIARIDSCTFVSTSTTTQPTYGLVDSTTQVIRIDDSVFDAGTVGFATKAAKLNTASKTAFVDNVSLLRGAEFDVASALTGYVIVGTSTANGRVTIT